MARIAVYAGHGGSDPGAVGNGFRESDLTLAVSNQASNILRGWGYTVINNRTTDVNRSITQDANLANNSQVDALVEIHLNSNVGIPGTGTEAFISIRDAGRARAIANAILRRIAALGYVNRGVKTQTNSAGQNAFGILRLTNMPAVLVELAFINNPRDMARFNVNEMARAVAEGIREVIPISVGGGLPSFPGISIRVGDRGESVRQTQRCLNSVGTRQPSIQRLAEDGIFGPITWEHLMSRCACGNITPVTRTAVATAEIETVPVVNVDVSSLGIEYSPNFAAKDTSATEFIEESLGTVTPAGSPISVNANDTERKRELIRLLIRELEG